MPEVSDFFAVFCRLPHVAGSPQARSPGLAAAEPPRPCLPSAALPSHTRNLHYRSNDRAQTKPLNAFACEGWRLPAAWLAWHISCVILSQWALRWGNN